MQFALGVADAEELVAYLATKKEQLFPEDYDQGSTQRQESLARRASLMLPMLRLDLRFLGHIASTHDFHPSATLLIAKIGERELFGVLATEQSMAPYEKLRWIDALNGCINAARKDSQSAIFQKKRALFEGLANEKFQLLKKRLLLELRKAQQASLLNISLKQTGSGVWNPDNPLRFLNQVQSSVAALNEDLQRSLNGRFLSSAWTIDYGSDNVYTVFISVLCAPLPFGGTEFPLNDSVEASWRRITAVPGQTSHSVWDYAKLRYEMNVLQWDSEASRKLLEKTAHYMCMPQTYMRLRPSEGVTCDGYLQGS